MSNTKVYELARELGEEIKKSIKPIENHKFPVLITNILIISKNTIINNIARIELKIILNETFDTNRANIKKAPIIP